MGKLVLYVLVAATIALSSLYFSLSWLLKDVPPSKKTTVKKQRIIVEGSYDGEHYEIIDTIYYEL